MSVENCITDSGPGRRGYIAVKPAKWSSILPWIVLAIIVGAGIWARWRYMQTGVYHIDEFISMLAIQMILVKGQPVFPSGQFYDNGLIFSYLGAAVVHLAGGDLLAARWWSLVMGGLTIVLVYILCRQLFGAYWWGLVAALEMAFLSDAIEWGGRVRMYSQATFILLMWLILAWWATLGGRHSWARLALIAALWLGLGTHAVLFLAIPPIALSLFLVWLLADDVRFSLQGSGRRIAIEVGVALIVLVLSVWMAGGSFIARYAAESSVLDSNLAAVNDNPVGGFLHIGLNEARLAKFGAYFSKDRMLPLSFIALLGILIAVTRAAQRQFQKDDLAGLFIAMSLVGILIELLLFLPDEWRKTRYNFILVYPIMLLLVVYALQSISDSITSHSPGSSRWMKSFGVACLVALGVFLPLLRFRDETIDVITGDGRIPNRYDLALEYVDVIRTPGDQLLTIRPAAGYLFSERLDFYANQVTPVIMRGPDGWLDRYAGVPYLAGVENLNQALNLSGTLWAVIDDQRLFEHFRPSFTQQLLHRMNNVRRFDNVLVLREMEESWPLAEAIGEPVAATVAPDLQFAGYTWDGPSVISPGETAYLTLFWLANEQLLDNKVFVHLRDGDGVTVGQADFVPLEQVDSELHQLLVTQAQEEYLRLGTRLSIPLDLPSGEYTLWSGLYDETTQQRLAVINDASGENAILLGEVVVD